MTRKLVFMCMVCAAFIACDASIDVEPTEQVKEGEQGVEQQRGPSQEQIDSVATAEAFRDSLRMNAKAVEFEQEQDSIRNDILNNLPNTLLKVSILEELYIRGGVFIAGDKLKFTLPFDRHGWDCGAPDCYTTDVSFSFDLGERLEFPKSVVFSEHEYGCVDEETSITGTFRLKEEEVDHITYYAAEHERTLIFFKGLERNGNCVYYFDGTVENGNVSSVGYRSLREWEEQDSIAPYTSWIFATEEYDTFTKK